MQILDFFIVPNRKSQHEDGYTLIEVLMTIAIFTVLVSIAVPSFLHWMPGIRLKDASTALLSDMYRAKAEAIKRNQNVVVQFSTVNCSPSVPGGQGNYLIFIDENDNNTFDASETSLLQRFMPDEVALCSEDETFGGNTGFTSRGFPIALNTGDIVLKNTDDRSHKVSLNAAGNISLN